MNWKAVCDDPTLQNLPYKIELNEHGSIVMSPASHQHNLIQHLLAVALEKRLDHGLVLPETSVDTPMGVKVADVTWMSEDFYATHGLETPYSRAPELCIEVLSPGNSRAELEEKIGLYLGRGAHEVWICDESGTLYMYDASGPIDRSAIVGEPIALDLPL